MELKTRGLDVKTPSRRKSAGSLGDPVARDNPRSRSVNRSGRADAFAAFADEVRRDLNPRGPIESVVADHVATAAWKLRGSAGRASTGPLGDPDAAHRPRATAAERAARSVREALELLELARQARREPAEAEVSDGPISCEVEPNEWTIVPFDDAEGILPFEPAAEGPEPPIWRDRLVFDFEVSDVSPVVRGTWITVGHVVSLIVDGDTWADILRSHPELTEDDIRCCVAYAVAQDQDQD